MAGSRRFRASASERACLQCQKRKTRCVSNGSDTTCSYCAKMSKACVFETPPTRTPLTRRNLDAAEARCKELELRLRQLQQATKAKSTTSNNTQTRDVVVAFQKDNPSGFSPHSANVVSRPVESPAELGFGWQEVSSLGNNQSPFQHKKIQDGMVSLAACGYSGKLD
jgi:transcriptional regulatory protein GAL4